MIYPEPPDNFNARFEIVSCFLENNGEILLLHRPAHKSQGDTWGMPGGKIDEGEDLRYAMAREVREETGLNLPPENFLHFNKYFVRYPDYDFTYHIFSLELPVRPAVSLNPDEHKGYQWLSPAKAIELANPILSLRECIRLFYYP